MRSVKWGVLGCAAFARSTAIPAMQIAEGVELYGIASRNLAKAESFRNEFGFVKAYGSYEEMLADPEIEAVYNPLPNGLHPEWTIKTVQAGKHSLTEKPFAASLQQAEEVAEATRASGRLVMEAFMWRFHPMHRRARQLLREGTIGAVHLVRAAFTFKLKREENIRLSDDLAGGGIMDVGCYCVSAARFLLEAEPVRVYGQADYDAEYGVDTLASGMLEFPEGRRALFDCGFDLPFRCEYEVVGERGRIVAHNAFLPGENAELSVEIDGESRREPFHGVNQWALEFEHLSRCIVEGTQPDYGLEDALKQQRVLDAIYRATRSGQPETL